MSNRRRSIETHESFEREEEVRSSSDRTFGIVATVFFVLVGLAPLKHGVPPRWWSLGVAAVFLTMALLIPRALAPANRLWFKLGLLLHAMVSPIVMALLFFVVVTPTALIMRALGKDPLRLRFDPDAPTYWVNRVPPGPPPDTMPRQF